ncbi:MAG: DUF1624 domain-containing protein [Bacteroidota bacterium]
MTAPANVLTEKSRISSIDMMRGIVMVIMALDHARDFFHQGALTSDPTNMETTTPALFFTRWITHFCAPTFVMLAGTSIFISSKKKSKAELSKFLLTRGFWLIALEFIVVRFAILFNFYFDIIIFQVIWVIGASMICMALLIHLPYRWTLGIGLVIVLGHNAGEAIQLQAGDSFYLPWTILRQTGFVNLTPQNSLMVLYPLLPWLGIMILGYCLGKLYVDFGAETRQKLLLRIGLLSIGLFIILRFVNVYGDPTPWSTQRNLIYTVMSFLNCAKYPVSLQYTLMTLGPVLMVLSWMEKIQLPSLRPFVIFGRVPLFYYVLHFTLIHAVSLALFMNKTGRSLSEIDFHFNQSFGGITSEGGYSLAWAYVGWLAVVIFLYPFCKWYNYYKSTHNQWWLSYL